MHPRAEELIQQLNLEPHPEGGYYRRIHRSESRVLREADGTRRRALTSIYYLLTEGSLSRWHRVLADEAWHHYEGAPLELLGFAADVPLTFSHRLGPLQGNAVDTAVIPTGRDCRYPEHREVNLVCPPWQLGSGNPCRNDEENLNSTALPLQEGDSPVYVVPAGWWQAARPLGAYSLVGCTVGPGFEFEDFTLLADLPEEERSAFPHFADFELFL